MLDLLLKILSIIGIILLVLLGILLALLFMVLFVPLRYHADGRKDSETLELYVRIRWLFGIFRVMAQYSSRFQLKVKLLWFTLFDMEDYLSDAAKDVPHNAKSIDDYREVLYDADADSKLSPGMESDSFQTENNDEHFQSQSQSLETKKHGLHTVYQKIEYKVHSICDRIKEIWKRIQLAWLNLQEIAHDFAYFKEVLEDKNTRALFDHVYVRLRKVFKALKPRKYKAELLFGTGSPDTTGYAYGIYGMLSPRLGNDIFVTPDFTRVVFEGSFDMSGHVMVFTILVQILCVVMDKKLHLFLDKVKRKQNTK